MAVALPAMPGGGHGGQGSQASQFTRLLAHSAFTPLQRSDPDATFGVVTGVSITI